MAALLKDHGAIFLRVIRIDSYGWQSQGNAAGGGSRERSYLADAFVDAGYNRVELCNARTYAASNHCEVQPYTAWPKNNGSLTITLNQGTFTDAASAYLYLCNANDVCSTGYAVSLSRLGAPTKGIVPGNLAGLLLAGFAGLAVPVAGRPSVLRGAGELTSLPIASAPLLADGLAGLMRTGPA